MPLGWWYSYHIGQVFGTTVELGCHICYDMGNPIFYVRFHYIGYGGLHKSLV